MNKHTHQGEGNRKFLLVVAVLTRVDTPTPTPLGLPLHCPLWWPPAMCDYLIVTQFHINHISSAHMS